MIINPISEEDIRRVREKFNRLEAAIDEALRLVTIQLDYLRKNDVELKDLMKPGAA